MILIEGQHYTLPDGTQVETVRVSSREWRLNDSDGTPLFYTDHGVLLRLEYYKNKDIYHLVPTDLTFDDLLIAD